MAKLPSYQILASLIEKVSTLLENERKIYRPVASNKNPGSLIYLDENKPVIVVPDIHARYEFLNNILNFPLPSDLELKIDKKNDCTVREALDNQLISVLCLGDAIHNESNKDRWHQIAWEFMSGETCGKSMKAEMSESLETLQILMELKLQYPENFHFLKGNHENVLNVTEGGDYAFVKYADEGEMVKLFIQNYYGDDVLYLISCYEDALPLIACGKNFAACHAEPAGFYTKDNLINAKMNPEIVKGLIWTANDQVNVNTAEFILKELLGNNYSEEAVMLGGHRPVPSRQNYLYRQNKKFIQIHNTRRQNIAIIYNDRPFDPDRFIYNVEGESDE